MANPTFDAELAINMTVNATFPKTPQRNARAAGAPELAVDSLDNTIPVGRARKRTADSPESQDQMANNAACFKAPQCKNEEDDCPKKWRVAKFF
jgi:hypothetical protein